MSESELKRCPFCGGEAELQITDDEGNFHSEEYLKDPYSGVGYVIVHQEAKDKECPIACYEGEHLGTYIYDSKEEAIAAWNRRAGEGDGK